MKFGKYKLNRCKNCKYYKKIGQHFHFCGNTKYYRKYGFESWAHIPLICFRKEKGE